MSTSVCVVGSIHMDLVVRAPRFPRPGETLLGGAFAIHPGGKGANQAVAAGRMGAHVSLVGCLGDDDWGSRLRGVLAAEGIDISHVRTNERAHTGVGIVTVVPSGENTIVVSPGADESLKPADVDEASSVIADASVLVLQGEVPFASNARALEIAKKSNTTVLFNAAPAAGVPHEALRDVDVLVVNVAQARALVGDEGREVSPKGLARRLASYGPERVVLTLGNEGALHFNGQEMEQFEAFPVEEVDSTASADAFVGALATLRAEGARLKDAVRYACAAAALASTAEGAIPSLPQRDAVEALVKRAVPTTG